MGAARLSVPALVLSALLHALVVAPLVINVKREHRAAAKPVAVTVGDHRDRRFVAVSTGGGGMSCESQYLGVGVRYLPGGRIIEVSPAGPADRAGIVVGDVLVRPYEEEFDGDLYVVRVLRSGAEVSFRMRREMICQEDAPARSWRHLD